jgi:serine/threonine protein phosphatase PrpC
MYLSARHLNIKLNQDSTNFICDKDFKSLIVCDGIGEFSQSQIVSEKVTEMMIEKRFDDINQLIQDSEIIALKDKIENGGTTIIFAILESNRKVKIQYLGNGGCIKLNGDFNQSSQGLLPYKYNHLINPDINNSGALTRHLSKKSGKQELIKSEISCYLNNPKGDILLFFSDGITSLEENAIIKDTEGRYWRHESSCIQVILEKLNVFLMDNNISDDFQDKLITFNEEILKDLNNLNLLEDDASLGIIITDEVLKYYRK